ncbi:MAG: T9SS type A sorting domain-containing protein, partial [Paludibacter sp.]|nr:T9SS type A sorting domain-containing protein [Paludibacter sp.]
TSSLNKNSIEVSNLARGIYTLRVTGKTTTETHRFVKR